jgi:hypothetical protein
MEEPECESRLLARSATVFYPERWNQNHATHAEPLNDCR